MTDHELPKPSERDNNLNSEDVNSEQTDGESSTRWQRVKEHRYFKPALAIGGFVVLGGVTLLATKSPEIKYSVKASILDGLSEFVFESDDATSDASKRKSPVGHTVGGHNRRQPYGPGRTETKMVPIQPYTRGG